MKADGLLPELVACQAAATPDAVAAVSEAEQLSYRELDDRCAGVAQALRAAGVGQESVVGVCLRRGVDQLVALLGVWRAGAAYLPMDPEHSTARLAWTTADAGAAVVLTEESLAGHLAEVDARLLTVRGLDGGDQPPLPEQPIDPDGVAYVVYTSGSTGTPKGVAVSHAAIANRVLWTVRQHAIGPSDRVLQKTALTFDAACWEFFAPLVAGGATVLAPPGVERDPAAMVEALVRHNATILQVVPSVLRLLVDEPRLAAATELRLVLSAGEPLHAELARRLRERVDVELWNTYGPTECAIDVTAQAVDREQLTGPVPIGRPIDNIRVLVLDDAGQPVPIGVPGQLYVGGVGLARGYVGAQAATARRFVPDPYGPPGERLYATGDRVRWRPDHALDYLGRLDHQVKVNGVRIEPSEVEAALTAHPAVRAAAASAFTAADGSLRLGAHVVLRDPAEEFDPAALREFLRGSLPMAMVPAAFRAVPALPMTASGKIDRVALAADGLFTDDGRQPPVEPRTATERAVAQVWSALIGHEQVGALDDFFQLGGTSLQLTRLASGLRAATGQDVDLSELYTATTVEAQARLVDTARPQVPAVRPVPRDRPLPLSYGQRRLWFLDQLRPGGSEWVVPLMTRLPVEIEPDTVRQALDALADRHEALRTTYSEVDGEPVQLVNPAQPSQLRIVDEPGCDVGRLCAEEFGRGFDLANGPVWRALLVRVNERERLLLLTTHHIACDGWSSMVLLRELREACAAFGRGSCPDWTALDVQYADFAVWQRETVTGELLEKQLAHWRTALAGMTPTELPTDRPRPPERDPRGDAVGFTLDPDVVAAVLAIGRRRGATPFMTLLTALAVLLARHTGEWDVAVGAPLAGRGRPETQGVVGFFLNSVVLRCVLDGHLDFVQALDRVAEVCRTAFANQDVPFDRLVDELRPVRDNSRTPLYQVAFDLHDLEATAGMPQEEDNGFFQQTWRTSKTDLTLYLSERPDGSMVGAFEFATALFDRETVEALSGHFTHLLGSVAEGGATRLAALELVPPAERQQLVVGWNDTARPVPNSDVPTLIAERVMAAGAATAVIAGADRMSYRELDERANQIARHLRAAGACQESVVGVLLDRGVDLVCSLLGVWRAGAAYLPLDASFPAQRLGHMLSDAGAVAVVSHQHHVGILADVFDGTTVLLDRDAEDIAARSNAPIGLSPDPDRLAYMIYTSGSTGRPKGVLVTHGGLLNHLWWAAEELASAGTTGAPLFSSVAYDLPAPSLWAPLLAGQPVRMLPAGLNVGDLGRSLAAAGPFSFIKLTPGHLELLLHQLTEQQADELAATYVVAGEALDNGLANSWLAMLGPGRLVNEYGPTEASVGTSVLPITRRQRSSTVPIGRPLPNMTMHVLDPDGGLAPLGVVGELYVGGAGVARGYANQPALTARRFVPDPFGPSGSRLYRTGDLVRRLADGTVAFVGRTDDQVKIRGHRVELGEIRGVLAEHPGVRAAVVVADQPAPRDVRLLAYCVPEAGQLPPAEVLRAHCAARLPAHMVPTRFIDVDQIPVNQNGKVDRSALPRPGAEVPQPPDDESATTVIRDAIAAIWAELLGSTVDTETDFFQLGGNSILGIRMIARVREEFGVDIPVRAVFDLPTVALLADAVEQRILAEVDELVDARLAADPVMGEERGA